MVDSDGWAGYVSALGALHAARDAAAEQARAARLDEVRRAEEVARLGTRVTQQEAALRALAAELRVPPAALDLTPGPVPACGPGDAVADLRSWLLAADTALAESRRLAALPRLLPAWPGTFARATVVYAGFAVPSLLLTVGLSLSGVRGNLAVLVGFAVVWPALTAVLGGLAVGYVSAPHLAATPIPGTPVGTASSARAHRYRWFGVLLTWASWLVPGALLDWAGSFWPG